MKVMVYGDMHLSSRGKRKHNAYPDESLFYLKFLTEQAEENDVGAIIGLGDFADGVFDNLKYAALVDGFLSRQFKQTKGRRYELRGNHDKSPKGYTQYDYYVETGRLLPPVTGLRLDNVTLDMVSYGDLTSLCAPSGSFKKRVVLAHDYLTFGDLTVSGGVGKGTPINIRDIPALKGTSLVLCGHIHEIAKLEGALSDGSLCRIVYPGCMTRPALSPDVKEQAAIAYIDTVTCEVTYELIDLLPIDVSFDLDRVAREKASKEQKVRVNEVGQGLDEVVRSLSAGSKPKELSALEIVRATRGASLEVVETAVKYLEAANIVGGKPK